jgi:hypothetical protein
MSLADIKLPRATVRKAIALSLTGSVIYLALTGEVSSGTLLSIYGTVLGFYFGENAAARAPGGEMTD